LTTSALPFVDAQGAPVTDIATATPVAGALGRHSRKPSNHSADE
jgi:hypothetical protein